MANNTYSMGNVAKQIDISSPGLRKWTETYSEFLSDGANPGPGKARRFTEEDVAFLMRVAKLRSTEELSHSDIVLKLRMESLAPDEDTDAPPEPPQDAPDAPQQALAPSMDMDTIAPLLAAIGAQQIKSEQLHAITDDIKRIDKANDQTRMILIAVLLAVLVLVVLLVVLLLR